MKNERVEYRLKTEEETFGRPFRRGRETRAEQAEQTFNKSREGPELLKSEREPNRAGGKVAASAKRVQSLFSMDRGMPSACSLRCRTRRAGSVRGGLPAGSFHRTRNTANPPFTSLIMSDSLICDDPFRCQDGQ